MLLELDPAIFSDDAERDALPVIRLVWLTTEGRHDWFPSPELFELAIPFLEKHLPTVRAWTEYLMNAATASAWQASGDRPALCVTTDNLEPLTNDLSKPAVLVVENGRNDGSFLKAVFAAYAPELRAAVEKNWLHIDHAGGTGEQGYIADDAAAKFRVICRVLVVKDNDNRFKDLPDPAQTDGWPPNRPCLHIWWRHEVENYLPDAVLQLSSHPAAPELVRLLREMTGEQQRWIDMKRGLARSPKELFDDLDDRCRRVWRNGFANTFPRPLVPDTVVLTVDDFRSLGEDVHAELTQLLGRIRRLV